MCARVWLPVYKLRCLALHACCLHLFVGHLFVGMTGIVGYVVDPPIAHRPGWQLRSCKSQSATVVRTAPDAQGALGRAGYQVQAVSPAVNAQVASRETRCARGLLKNCRQAAPATRHWPAVAPTRWVCCVIECQNKSVGCPPAGVNVQEHPLHKGIRQLAARCQGAQAVDVGQGPAVCPHRRRPAGGLGRGRWCCCCCQWGCISHGRHQRSCCPLVCEWARELQLPDCAA